MNSTKSALLTGAALALFAAPQVVWAQSIEFLPVPQDATFDSSEGAVINADGNVVTGFVGLELVQWTNGVPAYLGTFPSGSLDGFPANTRLFDFNDSGTISADGSTVIAHTTRGRITAANGRDYVDNGPYMWSKSDGYRALPLSINDGEYFVSNYGLSYDGSIAIFSTVEDSAAYGTPGGTNEYRAYRWTESGGYQSIGAFSPPASDAGNFQEFGIIATRISGDGNTIAGVTVEDNRYSLGLASIITPDAIMAAQSVFRWTEASGLVKLPSLAEAPLGGTLPHFSELFGISRDGSTLVGYSRDSSGLYQAAYWRGNAVVGLGFLPGSTPANAETAATAANADGSIIVGSATNGRGWRWTQSSGMQDLTNLAANAGLNLGGFVLTGPGGLSDNGSIIMGNAENASEERSSAFLLQLVELPPPPAPISAPLPFLPAANTANAPAQCRGPQDNQTTYASAMSADGTIIAGQSSTSNCIVLWNNLVPQVQAGSFPGHPELGNNIDQITSLSGDGRTVVGFTGVGGSDGSFNNYNVGPTMYWTAATDTKSMPTISALTAAQFNANPPVVVLALGVDIAHATSDVDRIPVGPGFVNSDGSFFAVNSAYSGSFAANNGHSALPFQFDGRVLRWSPTGGYLELPTFGEGTLMAATGIDGSGNLIVGAAYSQTLTQNFERTSHAFRWDASGGLSQLPDLAASFADSALVTQTAANGISRDGTTVFGFSRATDGLSHPVFWRGGAIADLGFLAGRTPTTTDLFGSNFHRALAASAGGAVIVGKVGDDCCGSGPTTDRAWRWTAATGMQELNQLATDAGFNLNGYDLYEANGVSDNGQLISGNAYKHLSGNLGYVLQIGAAPPPPTPVNTTSTARLLIRLTLPGITQESIVTQNFATQIDGRLNGAVVATRNVADTFTSAAGTAALNDVRGLLQQTNGLRRITIGAPVLISSTTTVLSSTSTTTNVASGTDVTTAIVTTSGPGTVATGDLGTCLTPAATNVNPTGCTLPGTPLAVEDGSTNTNTFTNTINSVTPNTHIEVSQQVTARWQVSATSGNQFGTVHALVGPAAFELGDRLIGQLLSMDGTSGGGAAPLARAAVPLRGVSGLADSGGGLSMFGGYFGNWSHINADPAVPVADVKGNANGVVLGLEQQLGAGHVGVAMDHGVSDYTVRDPALPETLAFKHTQLALFAGYGSGGFNLDAAAAFGFGTARTLLATPTTSAAAARDVRSWSLGGQAGYAVPLGQSASVTPVVGLRYTSAKLDSFAEAGGPTPLAGQDQTVSRTRLYAGLEAQAGIDLGTVTLTPRVHARYAHDSGNRSGTADLFFASAPSGPALQAIGPGVGRDVGELGGSLDMALSGSVNMWAGYGGTFRSGSTSHAAKVGVTLAW